MNSAKEQQISAERLDKIISETESQESGSTEVNAALFLSLLNELKERRQAASQPIGWTDEQELRSVENDGCGYLFKANPVSPNADPRRVILVYTAPPVRPLIPDEVIPLIESLKPEYGAPGSRDVEVTAKRDAVDAIIKLLRPGR